MPEQEEKLIELNGRRDVGGSDPFENVYTAILVQSFFVV